MGHESERQWLAQKPQRDRWLDEITHASTKLKRGEAASRVFWLMSHYSRGMQLVAEMREDVLKMRVRMKGSPLVRRRAEQGETIVDLDEKIRQELWMIKSTMEKLFGEDERPFPQDPPLPPGDDEGGGSEFKGSPVPNPQVPPAMSVHEAKKALDPPHF